MARIAIGGFGQETNSFIAERVDFAYFASHRDRPPLVRGDEIFSWFGSGSFPLDGFLGATKDRHTLLPLAWAHGSAGGIVTGEAFERIAGELVGHLSQAMPVDAVYLDLHGAMVTEPFEDGEGELLRRVRATVGEDVPVVVSLDYHANVTPEIVAYSDALLIFLTYPHVDRPETGRRAAEVLETLLTRGRPQGRAFRKADFIIPATAQCTLIEPSRGIAARSRHLAGGLVSLAYAAGFRHSDLYWCGPSVIAHADTQAEADVAADALMAEVVAAEAAFMRPLMPVHDGVTHAIARAVGATRPIVIADAQDNPGGGGSGDTTGIIQSLLAHDAPDAVVGILCDAAAAAAAHAVGERNTVRVALGGHSGPDGVTPVEREFEVTRLGSGRFLTTGVMAGGQQADLGPMALLKADGVRIVVASKRMQAFDQAPFQHLGVEPAREKIVVVKSAVHFRAEFEPIAEEVVLVAAPGNVVESGDLPYRRLRPGVRLTPMGNMLSGSPETA